MPEWPLKFGILRWTRASLALSARVAMKTRPSTTSLITLALLPGSRLARICSTPGLGLGRRDRFSTINTQLTAATRAYNSIPIHLENTKFPAVGPRVLNLSTRGTVSTGDNVLINGFIITGNDPKTVVLRALGPSLSDFGLSGVLADPVLTLHNSSGTVIASNDNWQTDLGSAFMAENGFAPTNPAESAALVQNLAPGAYTVVVTGTELDPGN